MPPAHFASGTCARSISCSTGRTCFPTSGCTCTTRSSRWGRVQNFGSWSPWMLGSPGTSCVGMEYFCSTGDPIWEATDEELIEQAKRELEGAGLAKGATVLDASSVRVPRAYPVYDQDYAGYLDTIQTWLARFENLQPIGRYGMFKYNNSDHSVLTALLAVENLYGAEHNVWAVNTDTEYHEVRPGRA